MREDNEFFTVSAPLGLLRRTALDWADGLREAFHSQAAFRSPMRVAPLPKGRQRASALGVTATLSVSAKTTHPDAATAALALLAEHTSRSVVPSARRLSADAMQRLAPHYSPNQIQLLADSLAVARVLVTRDQARTNQLHAALRDSLITPIAHRARPLDEILDSANHAVQAILDRP